MAIVGDYVKTYQEGVAGVSVPDTYLDSYQPTTKFGSATTLDIGWQTGKATTARRGLLQFNISDIPVGAIVRQADLECQMVTAAASAELAHVYRVVRTDWTEVGATWERYDGLTTWSTAGCGHDGNDYTSIDGVSFRLFAATGIQTISGLETLAQDAIDVRSGVLHLLLRRDTESATSAMMSIRSGEAVSSAWRPKLTVRYDLGLAVLGRRRRGLV